MSDGHVVFLNGAPSVGKSSLPRSDAGCVAAALMPVTKAAGSKVQRLGAYALCTQQGQILLSRFSPPDSRWGPPGGGVERGESPAAAVVREVAEETGLDVKVDRVVNVYSSVWGCDTVVHAISIVFEVSVVGGELRAESEGIRGCIYALLNACQRLRHLCDTRSSAASRP